MVIKINMMLKKSFSLLSDFSKWIIYIFNFLFFYYNQSGKIYKLLIIKKWA